MTFNKNQSSDNQLFVKVSITQGTTVTSNWTSETMDEHSIVCFPNLYHFQYIFFVCFQIKLFYNCFYNQAVIHWYFRLILCVILIVLHLAHGNFDPFHELLQHHENCIICSGETIDLSCMHVLLHLGPDQPIYSYISFLSPLFVCFYSWKNQWLRSLYTYNHLIYLTLKKLSPEQSKGQPNLWYWHHMRDI